MRPVTKLLLFLLVAVTAIGGTLLLRERDRRREAEAQADIDAGRILSAVFARARDLRVATLSGRAVAHASSDGLIFKPDQVTVAPYVVSYFLPLRRIRAGDLAWDRRSHVLTIAIPDIVVEPPSIDMARAVTRQHGMWISRGAGLEMQSRAAGILRARTMATATSAENLAKARAAAVAAMQAYAAQPLAAAGFRDVRVDVRFPWQGSGRPAPPIDRSRSIRQVFGLDP